MQQDTDIYRETYHSLCIMIHIITWGSRPYPALVLTKKTTSRAATVQQQPCYPTCYCSVIFPSCFNWMRRQISAAWLPPFFDSWGLSWKPHVIHVLCQAAKLPLPLARFCCCVFIFKGLGLRGDGWETDRAKASCILWGLCDRIRDGCKIWWTPSNWQRACVCTRRLPECELS